MEKMNKRGRSEFPRQLSEWVPQPLVWFFSYFLRRICILEVVILSTWNDSHISILAPGSIEPVMVMKSHCAPANGKQQMLSVTWGNSYAKGWETNATDTAFPRSSASISCSGHAGIRLPCEGQELSNLASPPPQNRHIWTLKATYSIIFEWPALTHLLFSQITSIFERCPEEKTSFQVISCSASSWVNQRLQTGRAKMRAWSLQLIGRLPEARGESQ